MSSAALTFMTAADLDVGVRSVVDVDLPVVEGIPCLDVRVRRSSAMESSRYVYVGSLVGRQSLVFLGRNLCLIHGVCWP